MAPWSAALEAHLGGGFRLGLQAVAAPTEAAAQGPLDSSLRGSPRRRPPLGPANSGSAYRGLAADKHQLLFDRLLRQLQWPELLGGRALPLGGAVAQPCPPHATLGC